MQNVTMRLEGRALVIEIDLDTELGPSKSGKSTLIATTGGNVRVPNTQDVMVGVTAFKYGARRQ
jgi:ABC-type uncharacterized transport system YnjBCD ATPase subunit